MSETLYRIACGMTAPEFSANHYHELECYKPVTGRRIQWCQPNQAGQSDALKGDGPCSDCGTTENPIWFTDSVLWNEVIRQGDYTEPTLCVNCFVVRTDEAGFACAWRLTPEFHWETKAEQAVRAFDKEDK